MADFTRRSLLTGAVGGFALTLGPTQRLLDLANFIAFDPLSNEKGAVTLRGYGRLSTRTIEEGGVKGIALTCQDEQSASLTLAKLKSDIERFGFVDRQTASFSGRTIFYWSISPDLAATAYRVGREVTYVAAPSPDALSKVVAKDAVFESTTPVPMWLDRWDKHGLLFYYNTFLEPPNFDASKGPYNYEGDFAFTQQVKSGFAVWEDEAANDTAEGLMNTPWWDWVRKESLRRQLPVHMNVAAIPTTWLLNRYRSETALKMPQFSGSFYRVADFHLGGNGILSWGSTKGMDAELGMIQSAVRDLADDPNIVGWLEPHSELGHGKQQLFLEYGPTSAASFQQFLQKRYPTLEKFNSTWGTEFKDWKDVPAPELAQFLGWNKDALDLKGIWKVSYEAMQPGVEYDPDQWRVAERRPIKSQPAPAEWFTTEFDDSSWGETEAPGDDRTMFLLKRPAVYRRKVELPVKWRAPKERVWLYIWDLNMAEGDLTIAYVNGQKVGQSAVPFWTPQWCVFEVTDQLRDGDNQLSIRLPNGYLGYRTYLSKVEPKNYPYLGETINARWVDFADWQGELRHQGVGRGADMIRQVDPNRPITFMSPDVYVDASKDVCQRVGGSMHDTGLMAGMWCDLMPMLSRSSGLAYDVEPGGPASSAEEFRSCFWKWLTEGIQGVSYFMHVGDIIWRDDVRQEFERMRPMLEKMGKHHVPKAEVALLFSQRCERILGYPWTLKSNESVGNGYWTWNLGANLLPLFPRDGITELDLSNGNADAYRVIIDTSTSVVSPKLLEEIERWVRNGGTFITFAHTGRHELTKPNTWPISKLTGFRVAAVERYNEQNEVVTDDWQKLKSAPGQNVFAPNWANAPKGNGLRLERQSSDAESLLLWESGSTAIGSRKLGKGKVVHVGCKFTDSKILDRIEVGMNSEAEQWLTRLFEELLTAEKVERVPGSVGDAGAPMLLRHTVSNSGLFDVWTLANRTKEPQTAMLTLSARAPAWCKEVGTGELIDLSKPLTFGNYQTRILVTPRGINASPEDWLAVQKGWWRAPEAPSNKKLPTSEDLQINARSLDEDWSFIPLTNASESDILGFAQPEANVADFAKRRIGLWGLHDQGDVKHAMLRREFVVPKNWNSGSVEIWVQSWVASTFLDRGRVFLDGKEIRGMDGGGVAGLLPNPPLLPGTKHVLAIEIEGVAQLRGVRANAWLGYVPKPEFAIDLAGEWTPSKDAMSLDAPIRLPGVWDTLMASRSITIDAKLADRVVVIQTIGQPMVLGVIVNGRYVRRHHHGIGNRTELNITPWIRFGEANDIALVAWEKPVTGTIDSVQLQFFDSKTYA